MNQRTQGINQLLATALSGFVQRSEGRGHFRIQSQQIDWRLAPHGPGFWLVLAGPGSGQERSLALATTGTLPWPLKGARRAPGSAVHWQAELYLCGGACDRPRLESLLSSLAGWLRPSRAARHAHPMVADWPGLVAEAIGEDLDRAAGDRYRLLTPAGTAIEWVEFEDELQVRSLLLRRGERAARTAVAAVDDLLSVANATQHGCRAVLTNHDDALEAWVEARLPWDTLTADAIRRALASVADAATRLSRPCEALCEYDDFTAGYQRFLLGQAGTAAVC